jgi:hypothetical protein
LAALPVKQTAATRSPTALTAAAVVMKAMMNPSGCPIVAPKAPTARMTVSATVATCTARFSRIWAASRVRGFTGVVNIRRSTPRSR